MTAAQSALLANIQQMMASLARGVSPRLEWRRRTFFRMISPQSLLILLLTTIDQMFGKRYLWVSLLPHRRTINPVWTLLFTDHWRQRVVIMDPTREFSPLYFAPFWTIGDTCAVQKHTI